MFESSRKCLYRCGSSAPSTNVYHVLPESASVIQDLTLPAAVVCDKCNRHFGIKLEKHFTECHPASRQRLYWVERTKSGKEPKFVDEAGETTRKTVDGERRFQFRFNHLKHRTDDRGDFVISGLSNRPSYSSKVISRLLAKITLECLYLNHRQGAFDPYETRFDSLAAYARFGAGRFRFFAWLPFEPKQRNPEIRELLDGAGKPLGIVCDVTFPGIRYIFPLNDDIDTEALRAHPFELNIVDEDAMIDQEPQSLNLKLERVRTAQ